MLTFSEIGLERVTDSAWSTQTIGTMLPSPNTLRNLLTLGGKLFAAELDGKIIGIAALTGRLHEAESIRSGVAENVLVLPQYRRQGVGRMLIGLLAGALMQENVYFLSGSVPNTVEAEAFARKLGFQMQQGSSNALLDLTDTTGLRRQH